MKIKIKLVFLATCFFLLGLLQSESVPLYDTWTYSNGSNVDYRPSISTSVSIDAGSSSYIYSGEYTGFSFIAPDSSIHISFDWESNLTIEWLSESKTSENEYDYVGGDVVVRFSHMNMSEILLEDFPILYYDWTNLPYSPYFKTYENSGHFDEYFNVEIGQEYPGWELDVWSELYGCGNYAGTAMAEITNFQIEYNLAGTGNITETPESATICLLGLSLIAVLARLYKLRM